MKWLLFCGVLLSPLSVEAKDFTVADLHAFCAGKNISYCQDFIGAVIIEFDNASFQRSWRDVICAPSSATRLDLGPLFSAWASENLDKAKLSASQGIILAFSRIWSC